MKLKFWNFCNFNLNQLRIENHAKAKPPRKNKIKFHKENNPKLNPLKNSGQKEGQGGRLMLKAKAKSQKVKKLIFKKNNKRDLVINELIPTNINRIDLITPWRSLSKRRALSPKTLKVKPLAKAKFKWETELYAIIRFKSLCTTVMNLAKHPPHKNQIRWILTCPHPEINQNPRTPIFNKTPAKTILPRVGLSTWALGNHKWIPNTGIFTKNIKLNKINLTLPKLPNGIKNKKFQSTNKTRAIPGSEKNKV